MAIKAIVAMNKDRAIGKGGRLPWHHPADLRFFRETTSGNAIVMGANTWRSLGRPLPGRLNIVMTRSGAIESPAAVMKLSETDEVVDLAKYLNRDVFIIGGARTYEEFADVIEEWYITLVPDEVIGADTFMPMDFLDAFQEATSTDLGEGLVVKTFIRRSK